MSITYMEISENNLYVQYVECIQNKNLRIRKYEVDTVVA